MKGSEIVNAKKALNEFTDAKRNKDRLSVVKFTREADIIGKFKKSKTKIKKDINKIKAGGKTDVDKGLKKAIKLYTEKEYINASYFPFVRSNPTKKDSDNDKYNDKIDKKPLHKATKILGNKTKHGPEMFKLEKNSLIKFEGSRQYFDEHYVTITGILTNEQDNTYRLQVISDNDTFYKAKSIAKKMGITIHIT